MEMMTYLHRIAQIDQAARRHQLTQILKEMASPFVIHEQAVGDLLVQNVVIAFHDGRPQASRLVVGAHYDSAPGSSGANDNGAAVCVLVTLVQQLRAKPPRFPLDVVFFDREEGALAGSRAYVEQVGTQAIAGMINLDVCGVGDTILVGPAEQLEGTVLAAPVTAVSQSEQHPVIMMPQLPTGDEHSFLEAGIPAVTVATLPHAEVVPFQEAMAAMRRGEQPEMMPPILETMHKGPRDSIDVIEPRAMALVLEWISDVIQQFSQAGILDKAQPEKR